MIESLYIGATGMLAQQANVDSIANNLANVNTTGFKKNRVSFEDVFNRTAQSAATGNGGAAGDLQVGMGTLVSSNAKSFTAGELKQSESPLDVAIRGHGLFEVQLPDGTSAYTRHGALTVDKDGQLATTSGHPLKQLIQIPSDALEIKIDAAGLISARLPNERELTELGQIELTLFPNLEGLEPIGGNLFTPSERAGAPSTGKPGENGLGNLSQGYLESSNVKMAEEMVNLVLAQRAYELNARVIQASDEMLAISNNLRR